MIIVGLGSRKGVGKDFCADYLVKHHNFYRVAFADPLKDLLGVVFGFDHEQLYGTRKEEVCDYWKVSPRWLCQKIGTQLFREALGDLAAKEGLWTPEESNQIWIRAAKRKILQVPPSYNGVVVSDVRFKNELDCVKDMGGHVVQVTRPGIDMSSTHASEAELDDPSLWDDTFVNIGDRYISYLDDLVAKLSKQ